jgi:hypothetical protein
MNNFIPLGPIVKTASRRDAMQRKGARKYLMVAADQSTPCKAKETDENSEIKRDLPGNKTGA